MAAFSHGNRRRSEGATCCMWTKLTTQQLQTSISVSFLLSVCHCEDGKLQNAVAKLFEVGDAGGEKNRFQRLNDFTWQALESGFGVCRRFFLKTAACRGVSQQQSRLSHICHMCKMHPDVYAHTLATTAKQLPGSRVANFADDDNISAQF